MMKTMQPALRNGRNIWDPINMPPQEFQERGRKAQEGMKERGIDCLLAYGSAFDEYANPCYFSNYVIRLPKGFMVAIPKEGDLTLFFEGASRGLPSARMITWIQDVRACPDVAKKCHDYLKEKGFIPGTIGEAGLRRLMPYRQLRSLTEALEGCTILDAEDMVLGMRMIKSQRELDQIRRASRVVKQCLDLLTGRAFQNMNERAVEAYLIKEARMEGAEDARLLLGCSGDPQWALRPSENREISDSSTLVVYLAVSYERYWSAALRTYVIQDRSLSLPELGGLDSFYRGRIAEIHPGAPVFQWYEETLREIKDIGGEFMEPYGLGEGIGLSPRERPFIEGGSTEVFQEGMCLSLRAGLRDEALGNVMIGDTFLLDRSGPLCLTL